MWDQKYIKELESRNAVRDAAGGEARVAKQHEQGKMTARERVEFLFDKGTFVEIGAFQQSEAAYLPEKKRLPGDGVVTGYGKINGRLVYASSQDFTVNGGTLGAVHAQKICHAMDLAVKSRAPFVCINDGGGARIEEGVHALDGYAEIFKRNTHASGLIPQISVVLGPCAGGACYSPAITDFIFMVENTAQMFITGPGVVKAVTGEQISAMDLGGAQVHKATSGVVHFAYPNDKSCLEGVRKLLEYLPQSAFDVSPVKKFTYKDRSSEIQDLVPENAKRVFDVRQPISVLVDDDSFFEVQPDFAKNVVVGFARIEGKSVGIIASQPSYLAGTLDIDASDKAARFIRFCDCFNIPLLTMADVPGYMPGKKQEYNGIIRHGAKLLYAYAEATVPKITLIMRKAFGGAYIAMDSKHLGSDYVLAWPIAQIAVMGAEGAVDIIHKKEIAAAADPKQARADFIAQYEAEHLNPYIAANTGSIDEVVAPTETRARIIAAFNSLEASRSIPTEFKKHGNVPL